AVSAARLVGLSPDCSPLGRLGAPLGGCAPPRRRRVTAVDGARLEEEMDACQATLAPLRSFVLPGGARLNTDLHVARTVCRRAERIAVALGRQETIPQEAVRYLNRLSDALFVWSRWASHAAGVNETLWEPNRSSSGLS